MTERNTLKPWVYEGTDQWSTPVGLDWERIGRSVFDELVEPKNWEWEAVDRVTNLQFVYFDRTAEPLLSEPAEPALLIQWVQGDRQFGLLATISRMAYQVGSDDPGEIAAYVKLAVDEPQPGIAGETVWINSLPTALAY
jgi:hypothetical protein